MVVKPPNTVAIWEDRARPQGVSTTLRPLTHQLELTERQAVVQAIRGCSVEGCNRVHHGRGLCRFHYQRWARTGSAARPSPMVRICSVEDCERVHWGRGMCRVHYRRRARNGTTDLLSLPTPAERLAAKLERKSNGCLEWTGTTTRGYGTIRINGKAVRTHRLAWTLANGPIPDGLLIRHYVCDNPPCCDVTHLRPGTVADNNADAIGKKTHCPQNHPYDEANTYVDKRGRRRCRICKKAATDRYRARIAA